ncbi:MAG: nucleotidyltransferase family protein [Thermodesulfobacteriota bacterium]
MHILRKQLPYLQERYGVERIAIYGSFAKGNQKKRSDVDILVQLMKPLGLEFVQLAYHLEKILKKKVDLATFDTLRRSLENPRYKDIASDIERTLIYV